MGTRDRESVCGFLRHDQGSLPLGVSLRTALDAVDGQMLVDLDGALIKVHVSPCQREKFADAATGAQEHPQAGDHLMVCADHHHHHLHVISRDKRARLGEVLASPLDHAGDDGTLPSFTARFITEEIVPYALFRLFGLSSIESHHLTIIE